MLDGGADEEAGADDGGGVEEVDSTEEVEDVVGSGAFDDVGGV
jgi:hypothetical protein